MEIGEALGGGSGEVERFAEQRIGAQRRHEAKGCRAARPRSVRSGFAEDAGATMAMPAHGGRPVALSERVISPRLSASDERGRAGEEKLFRGPLHATVCAAARSHHGERRNATAQSQRSRSRRRAAGAGRSGGAHAALEDANFDLAVRSRCARTPRWSAAENRGCAQISAPSACHGLPATVNSALSTRITK